MMHDNWVLVSHLVCLLKHAQWDTWLFFWNNTFQYVHHCLILLVQSKIHDIGLFRCYALFVSLVPSQFI